MTSQLGQLQLPLDDSASAELEGEGGASLVAGIDLVAIGGQGAAVMYLN